MDLRKSHESSIRTCGLPEVCIRRPLQACFRTGILTSLLLIAAAQLPSQSPSQQTDRPTAEPARITVHGVVHNGATGDPLARALVQIEGDANTGTLTDGEGRFEIPGVPAGPQIFRVVKPGFRDRPYATEETGLQAEGPPHSVMVAAEMPELAFALAPDCAIRGHIELSTGDPSSGITVILLRQVVRFGRAVWVLESNTRANGDGAYRFGGLPDGTYAVYTQPALESEPAVSLVATGSAVNVARSGYPSVFYPDARDLAGAARIRLSGGSQTDANFSLALEPFYPVTAVEASQAAAPREGKIRQSAYNATFMDATGHPLPYAAQYDDATHSLQANLPDGTYLLVARGFPRAASSSDEAINGFSGRTERRVLAGTVEFTVAGHPVNGLRFALGPPPPATVHLRLVHNSDSPPASLAGAIANEIVNLNVDPADGIPQNSFENIWSMDSGADTITFTAMPGAYWLSAYVPRKGLCAGPFSAGSFNLAREPLKLSLTTSPSPMELTLRDDCATLALTLPAAVATFLPGEEPFYTVYLVPDFDTVQDTPPMTVHPSSGATLNLDGLTPGSYHVYTFDRPVHLEYRNPAALAALPNAGQQVTLSAGAPASLILEVPEH